MPSLSMPMNLFRHVLPIFILSLLIAACGLPPTAPPERIIQFSGYEWRIRDSGFGEPGPNQWDGANVWLDDDGNLHLKITHTGNGWRCAELETTQRLGFGRYQFQVIGRIDNLDPNVVLGLFSYPTEDVGTDGTNEINIEYTKWGYPEMTNGSWTVYPAQPGLKEAIEPFSVELSGTYTTHRFTRESRQIYFQSLHGHRDDENEFASWIYKPQEPLKYISQQAMPVHINLWLFDGQAPMDGNEVEVIIRSFTFTPLQ